MTFTVKKAYVIVSDSLTEPFSLPLHRVKAEIQIQSRKIIL